MFHGTGVRIEEIETPFPDVAGHVFDREEARALRESADRRSDRVAIVDLRIAPGKRGAGIREISMLTSADLVAPGVLSAVGAARGKFPLGF